MVTFPKIHWGRILIGGFLAVGSVWTFVLANSIFFEQHSSRYASPLASMLACFLFAFWVGQRVDASFVLHGALVGVVAILIEFGLTRGQLGAWPYVVGQALSVPCGAAGGLVAGRLGRLFGIRKEGQRIVAAPQMQALAIACGVLIGSFLFQRFGFNNRGLLDGWEWYLVAVLLAGIGLAGIFPEVQFSATIGLCLGPTVVFCIEVVVLHPAESMWPIVLPMIFLFSWPVPLLGSGISRLLTRTWLPRAVYVVALTSALVIGVLLPNIQNAKRQKFETETVPELPKQIYNAEMIYSARQPDGNFACDGTLLPGAVGKLGWDHGDSSTTKKYLRVEYYNISLDCPNEINPRSFGVTADSNNGYIHAPHLYMNETGKLSVAPWPKGPNTH